MNNNKLFIPVSVFFLGVISVLAVLVFIDQQKLAKLEKLIQLPNAQTISEETETASQSACSGKTDESLQGQLANLDKCQAGDYTSLLSGKIQDNDSLNYHIAKALLEHDHAVCNEIQETDSRNACLLAFSRYVNILDGNNQSFGDLQKPETDSLIEKAFFANDASLCDKIIDEPAKISCQAIIAADSSKCSQITQNCETATPGNCNNAASRTSSCENLVYISSALKNKDIAGCQKINPQIDYDTQMYCNLLLSSSPREIFTEYMNTLCFGKYAKELAIKERDIAICEDIPSLKTKNQIRYQECVDSMKKQATDDLSTADAQN